MVKSLKSLALNLNEYEYIGEDVAITGAHINSKEISKGQLFVALQSLRDGHDFIEDAIANGAVAILVNKKQSVLEVSQIIVNDTRKALFDLALIYRKTLSIPVLSITGSCGKTTTKEMLVCMLKAFGKVHYSEGSFNNDLGVAMTVLSTPQYADFVVIEAGTNAPGEILHLTQLIQPDCAAITNVSASHLEKLKSLEGVMIEKGALLKAIKGNGKAIINLDDPRINSFSKDLSVDKITFSMIKTNADIYLCDQIKSVKMLGFTLSIKAKLYDVQLNIIGTHNIQNILTAISFIHALQLDIQGALKSLSNYQPCQGRFSLACLNNYITVIDDTYNASVQSVKAAIKNLPKFSGDKYIVLSNIGELGEYSEVYHQEIGRLINKSVIDYVYLYGNKKWMTSLAKETGYNARYFENKNELIWALFDDLKRNNYILSCILVKGSRANKMEEVVEALTKYYKKIE